MQPSLLESLKLWQPMNMASLERLLLLKSIELHEPALEAVSRELRDRLHWLSVKVIEQDLSLYEQEILGLPASYEALNELKGLLESIRAACPNALQP